MDTGGGMYGGAMYGGMDPMSGGFGDQNTGGFMDAGGSAVKSEKKVFIIDS